MKGKRLRFGDVLALLLPIGAFGLWALSYFHSSTISYPRGQSTTYFLSSEQGQIRLAQQAVTLFKTVQRVDTTRYRYISVMYGGFESQYEFSQNVDAEIAFLGFDYDSWDPGDTMGSHRIYEIMFGIPYWFIALLSGAPFGLVARGCIHRRSRLARGQCVLCGYDLRATPDRCPECGTEGNRRATEVAERKTERPK